MDTSTIGLMSASIKLVYHLYLTSPLGAFISLILSPNRFISIESTAIERQDKVDRPNKKSVFSRHSDDSFLLRAGCAGALNHNETRKTVKSDLVTLDAECNFCKMLGFSGQWGCRVELWIQLQIYVSLERADS